MIDDEKSIGEEFGLFDFFGGIGGLVKDSAGRGLEDSGAGKFVLQQWRDEIFESGREGG